jgi:hypothetical protein
LPELKRAVATFLAASLFGAAPSNASIADVLRDPRFSRLELAPIAPALASTVASTYPVGSASSSVLYVYDPTTETLVRQTGIAGPIIGERAETIGRGQFNFGASYAYVHLATINGDELDGLVNRRRVNGRTIIFPVPGGLTLRDGRFTNYLPVRVQTDLDVDAHIATPSLTYGITPDLDVNVTVPFLRTSLDVQARTRVPDPRFPQFALPPGDPNVQDDVRSAGDDAVGIGDVLVRAKYVLLRQRAVDVAAQLGLSLPTGSQDDLQGTGTTRVQPLLVLSRVIGRVEPLLNLGVDFDADDVDRSVMRWAIGATGQVLDALSVSAVFLGRHELAAQSDPIETPFFFQVERNDQYDVSVGARYHFADAGLVGVAAIVPLNEQGLRPDVIPILSLEYAF